MFQSVMINSHSSANRWMDMTHAHVSLLSMKSLLTILVMMVLSAHGQAPWEKPGCHIAAYTRRVYIPGCVAFEAHTNACRGFCTSYAIPSSVPTLLSNPNHIFTSRAECCAITSTHDVKIRVRCHTGYRDLVFKSAASCACSVCRNG